MIKLDHITQTYKTPEGREFKALDDVSIEIRPGEIFGIIGRSGAGKSTLVRCINLLNRPSEGTVTVDGKNLTELSEDELRESRRSIGMIFQHFNLLSSRTVYDNVALPLELVGTPKNVIREKVEPLLKLVGLTEHAHKYPSQLSGGQKQRVGIARALTNDPKVLLSDEATSALDPETTVATLALLKRINKELGLTIVMITHEMQVVKQICERVVVMNYGKIVEQGKVVDIFMSPQHETTKALIGNVMARDMPASILDRFTRLAKTIPTATQSTCFASPSRATKSRAPSFPNARAASTSTSTSSAALSTTSRARPSARSPYSSRPKAAYSSKPSTS